MWEVVSDEDKQGMARHLFEYLTYDLSTKQIVDFRLKPWAEQFLTLRAGLYADELLQVNGNPIAPTGFDITRIPFMNTAIQRVLDLLYAGISLPEKPVTDKQLPLTERNQLIRVHYATGETLQAIAQDFGISHQRVHQIIQE